MANPKKDEQPARHAGPKYKRPIIPDSFTISRAPNPMRSILDEAEAEKDEQSQSASLPLEDRVGRIADMVEERRGHMATQPYSHPTIQPLAIQEPPLADHPTIQPPNHTATQSSKIEWPASQREDTGPRASKDFSRMPSRWGKISATYRINEKLQRDFEARHRGHMSAIIEDFINSLLTGQPPSHPATQNWWSATQSYGHTAIQPHDLMNDDDIILNSREISSSSFNQGGQPPSHPTTYHVDEALRFYEEWTNNVIDAKAVAARASLSDDIPINTIKAGILKCIWAAKRKINSFQYFLQEIVAIHEECLVTGTPPGAELIKFYMMKIALDRGMRFVAPSERAWIEQMLQVKGKEIK